MELIYNARPIDAVEAERIGLVSYVYALLAQEYASLANRVLADNDIAEGVSAFKEKRPPKFRGSQKQPRWQNY